ANDNTNYGTGGSVTLKNSGGNSYDRKGYIRFDVGDMVSEASLVMTVSTNNEGGGGTTPQTFTIEVYGLAESLDHTWTESEITWNNAPGNDTSNSNFTEDATPLGSFIVEPIPVGNVVSFSDPNLVDFINSDTDNQITLLLRRTPGTSSSHNIAFASKENSNYSPPALNMEVATRAFGPDPANGALIETTWASLSWRALDSAISHDVYIGDNLDDVSDGVGDSFQVNQTDTTVLVGFPGFPIPGGLIPGTTYYWRIDEVNDADPNSPWKGSVWSFSISPETAYNPDPADGAEFVDPNQVFTWSPGYGAKLHTVYMGTSFDEVNDAAGGAPVGSASYNPGTLESEKVYYWRVDEFDAISTYKGDIWSFTTPGAVGNSQPANGTADVSMVATLSWTPADTAASSDLYFGADADAVYNATTASPEYMGNKALGSETYDPGKLALDSTYHWRVDAVYPDKTVKGLLWSFETAEFIGVDDFEAYNDIDPPDPNSNRIFDKWIDGFGTTTNGALVGNDLPPYAEQTVVHGGDQSMIYSYDNANKTSEATLTLTYPRNWTEDGGAKLSLWFLGASANAADRMFVALGSAVVYHDDPAATQLTGWNEWVIDLQAFAGVDLTNVNTVTIGVGTKGSPAAGGTGTMYFDDIRLVR
ncbi:MAG: DNRLRE domain-containing protein, partial [Planctomycetota bacterium]